MASPRRIRLSVLLFSLLLTGVIALGAAFLFRNTALRWYSLHKLRSPDATVRLEGMVYVCLHARQDAAVRQTLSEWLSDESTDEQLRTAIIRSLRCAEVWGPGFGKPWLTWLGNYTKEPDGKFPGAGAAEGQRVGVCFEIAKAAFAHQPVVNDSQAAELLKMLAQDKSADVRYWAVRAAATLPASSMQSVLAIALTDAEPVVARHAKIIESLNKGEQPVCPTTDFSPLYAMNLQQLAEVYRNAATSGTVEDDAKAAYAASRLASHFGTDPAADVLQPITWTGRDGYQLRELAVLENLPAKSVDMMIDNDWPPLVRIAAAHVAKDLPEPELLNLFDTDDPTLRLLACYTAINRLSESEMRHAIDRLNHTFYDNERMCGALLIGLTGLEPGVIDERLKRETVWLVQMHLQLAKWMLATPAQGFHIEGLLTNGAFPRSALYAAMLHRGQIAALDLIFQPFSADAGQLRLLLDHERFLPVLTRYLNAGQPKFDLYADAQTQQFQADALRDWYMMRRSQLHFDPARRQFVIPDAQ